MAPDEILVHLLGCFHSGVIPFVVSPLLWHLQGDKSGDQSFLGKNSLSVATTKNLIALAKRYNVRACICDFNVQTNYAQIAHREGNLFHECRLPFVCLAYPAVAYAELSPPEAMGSADLEIEKDPNVLYLPRGACFRKEQGLARNEATSMVVGFTADELEKLTY